ncbi:uncharacterized protein TRAVEDRAFT_17321 [Trametes versicolor FP-101664 SS1]|uniref:uncharacterized protein n=1 Tax=Trametes versicolor (strain FP-101664) TaxID=717944 RepID=UPI00046249A6|nr:uncharacterized protein TRAVEDRAFT_17321 [Trametes versicolor FP-101664 SS1]EIW62730.1 hypothetical protein TRAVEDRAFT_17321 [Trametes versicolor FP-101664 SS1]
MASQAVKTRSGRQSKPSEKKGYMDGQQDPDNTGKKAKRKRGDKENAPEKKKGKVQHEPAQKEVSSRMTALASVRGTHPKQFNIVALPTNSTANKSQSIDLRARSAPIPKPKVTPARKVAGERHPVPTSSPRRTLTPANRERLLQLKKPFGAASVGRHATAATMPSMSQPEARKMERPKRKQYSSSQPVQSVRPRHPRESGQRVRHQQITYGRPKLAQVTEDHEDRHTSDQRRGYVNTSQYDQGEGEEGGGGNEDDDEHQGEYGSHADEGDDWSGYPQQDADDEQEEDDYDPDMDDMVPRPSAAPSQDWRGMENHLTGMSYNPHFHLHC